MATIILNAEIFDVIFNKQIHNFGAILATRKNPIPHQCPQVPGSRRSLHAFRGSSGTLENTACNQIQVTSRHAVPQQGQNASQGDIFLSVSGTLLGSGTLMGMPKLLLFRQRKPPFREDIKLKPEIVSITNGQVSTEIRVPADPDFDEGAIQIYAWSADEEALGYATYRVLDRYVKNVRLVRLFRSQLESTDAPLRGSRRQKCY